MSDKISIFRLTGKVQHYQWGGYDYIPQLLNMTNDKHQPFAEYWLGAHDNAPAQLPDGNGLNDLINKQPAHLGVAAQKKFGRLPYLLKILDVKDMLSIQVHPNKKAAEYEFDAENKKGTPLSAGHRNYKDDNHKPELMTALSDFWLLHGFQEPNKLKDTLAAVPELVFLLPVFAESNYKALYEKVMTMDQAEVNKVLQPLLDRIIRLYKENKLQKSSPDFWASRAALTFNVGDNIDRGIFSIYLFNVLNVKPGDAVFQDAGLLHAYLEGQNVEIMANSDNVLRGGLTPKHIDVSELMKHVLFEPTIPNILKGDMVSTAERVYKTPAPDFELSKILLSPSGKTQLNIASTDIFLVLAGKATVSTATDKQEFAKGEAFAAVSGSVITIDSAQGAEIYRASVPG